MFVGVLGDCLGEYAHFVAYGLWYFVFLGLSRGICSIRGLEPVVLLVCWDCLQKWPFDMTRQFLRKNAHVHKQKYRCLLKSNYSHIIRMHLCHELQTLICT